MPAIAFISERRVGDCKLSSLWEPVLSLWLLSFIPSPPCPQPVSVHGIPAAACHVQVLTTLKVESP